MTAFGKDEAEGKPKFSWAGLVRLAGAVSSSLISSTFSVIYTRHSHFRFRFEHPEGSLMNMNEALVAYGKWAFALPAVALTAGLVLLCTRAKSDVAFELCIAGAWVSSLLMVVIPVLCWQTQNVPIFTHMQWHF